MSNPRTGNPFNETSHMSEHFISNIVVGIPINTPISLNGVYFENIDTNRTSYTIHTL